MVKLCYYCAVTDKLLAHKTINRRIAEREAKYFRRNSSSKVYIVLE